MCKICNRKTTTGHLLFWFFTWLVNFDFKKAGFTFYHIFNRKAYWKWREQQNHYKRALRALNNLRFATDEMADIAVDTELNELNNGK